MSLKIQRESIIISLLIVLDKDLEGCDFEFGDRHATNIK
jgi:hypothetical protein